MARAFFGGKAFEQWVKGREAESKLQGAIVDRLNGVIRGLNVVAKAASRGG